ncbi:hypothetical protein FOG18_05205 [Legionella israelensis]|uniref:hypothetical protein n=1 Tax=Legionella israelensis TaxID=454 RepID=UPI00117DE841|nr:hypothetical protein [Legionella israelensis]QDP72012.1 hypothetical protein FOG18_05205 [Legionella israelensis]
MINNRYTASLNQVSNYKELNEKIAAYRKEYLKNASLKMIIIPTGIFVQSFEFMTSNTVQISGYVWQKIAKKDLAQGVLPGVIFPEAKSVALMEQAYEVDFDKYKLMAWRFSGATLLQNFNYSKYPFDVQDIWIRMWPKDFTKDVLLVPDFSSYKRTKSDSIFGLEKDIVKHGFEFKETYFDMPVLHYDTTFGFPPSLEENNFLELYFNIIIKRHLINSFLIHLSPIVVVWFILFAITMIITDKPQMASRVGLSTTQLFIALGGTVFSLILMHAGLRREYSEQPVLYLEYFYLITYVIIILVSYNAYIVTTQKSLPKMLKNNLLAKTLFWPVILVFIIVLTILKFFISEDYVGVSSHVMTPVS